MKTITNDLLAMFDKWLEEARAEQESEKSNDKAWISWNHGYQTGKVSILETLTKNIREGLIECRYGS